jgi:hypothetical protein
VKKHRADGRATKAKPPFWIYIVGCLAIVAVVLAFPASTWLRWQQTKITDRQTREILSRELPVGTDKSRVKLFLDGKHWAYSDRGSIIQASIRDASRGSLIRADIRMQFFFDSQDKLTSYEIKDLLTGP